MSPEFGSAAQTRRIAEAHTQFGYELALEHTAYLENVGRWEAQYAGAAAEVGLANARILYGNTLATAAFKEQQLLRELRGWFTPTHYIPFRNYIQALADAPVAPLVLQPLQPLPNRAAWEGANPRPAEVVPVRPADPVNPLLASHLWILTNALTFVELGVAPLFGAPFGFGEGVDWGSELSSSMSKFISAYETLNSAYPSPLEWSSASAALYTEDNQYLQFSAAQAGATGILAAALDGPSYDVQFQNWIGAQAALVELMQVILAIFGVGLVLCQRIALGLEVLWGVGGSIPFQMAMATTTLTAVASILMATGYLTKSLADKINGVAAAYNTLAADVEAATKKVPTTPPTAGSVAAASTTPWFGGVGLFAKPDQSPAANAVNESTDQHGRAHAPRAAGAVFPSSPPAAPREPVTSADQAPPESPSSSQPDEPLTGSRPATQPVSPRRQHAAPTRQTTPAAGANANGAAIPSAHAAPTSDAEETMAGGSAGPGETERVPAEIATLLPDQTAATKPGETRRIPASASQSHERRE